MTGPEHPDARQAKDARLEIEALWAAVKKFVAKWRTMSGGETVKDIDAALAEAFSVSPEAVAMVASSAEGTGEADAALADGRSPKAKNGQDCSVQREDAGRSQGADRSS